MVVTEIPSSASKNEDRLAFLADGGEMGARIRAFDWADSPLGSPENWPQALKTKMGILLG